MAQPQDRRIKHGRYGGRLYRIWAEMKASCRRPSHRSYKATGAKGISYAPAWEEFPAFAKWAAHSGYAPDLTLARKDRNQSFSPENCHWKVFKARGPKRWQFAATEIEDPPQSDGEVLGIIEKDVPLPPQAYPGRQGPKRRWPFAEMDPGDSFLIVTDMPEREARLAFAAAKRVGARIAMRYREGGIRIWRLHPKANMELRRERMEPR